MVRFLGLRPPKWLYLLFLLGACTIATRVVLDSQFGSTGVFYIAFPFLISLAIYHFVGPARGRSPWARLANHFRIATVIMLGTSAFLFEGFLCVAMMMPIYYLILGITYAFIIVEEKTKRDRAGGARLGVYAVPLVILLLSLEGVSPQTSLARANSVSYSAVVPDSVAGLKANMARPITFDASRQWFIALFPAPVRVEAGSLKPGVVHRLHFVYRKWIFTNEHRGVMDVRIAEVSENRVTTVIDHNTSYLSHYMRLRGTTVDFTPVDAGHTRVTISIRYSRSLDPAWYFGPLQRLAVRQSARYLLETVIARRPVHD